MLPRVRTVNYETPYRLMITFENQETKEFDLKPYLNYPVFEKLKDENFCRNVSVQYGTVVWDSETDFDPDTLYLESKTIAFQN